MLLGAVRCSLCSPPETRSWSDDIDMPVIPDDGYYLRCEARSDCNLAWKEDMIMIMIVIISLCVELEQFVYRRFGVE